MGVRAYQHAMNQIIVYGRIERQKHLHDHPDKKAPGTYLSPSAQLMLGHIALSAYELESSLKTGHWNPDDQNGDGIIFYQGLGKRARALGFDLPEDFGKHMVLAGEVDEKLYNTARMASDRALRELVSKNLISRLVDAAAGRNARYFLDFLTRPCPTCLDPEGEDQERDLSRHLNA